MEGCFAAEMLRLLFFFGLTILHLPLQYYYIKVIRVFVIIIYSILILALENNLLYNLVNWLTCKLKARKERWQLNCSYLQFIYCVSSLAFFQVKARLSTTALETQVPKFSLSQAEAKQLLDRCH